MTEHDPQRPPNGSGSTDRDPWDFSDFGEQSAGRSFVPEVHPVDGSRGVGRTDSPVDFGSPASTAPGLSVARPPLTWLGVSVAAALLGLLLAALLGALPPLAVIGWLLAGPVAIGALAVYISIDTRRRAGAVYVAPNWLTAAYYACLVVCLAGVVVAAVRIALWVGRW